MIGIIGYQDEVIGFGLAGITKKIELTRASGKQEILEAIKLLAQDTEALLINESLHEKIQGHKELPNIILIDIPERTDVTNLDAVEALIKETLGISI